MSLIKIFEKLTWNLDYFFEKGIVVSLEHFDIQEYAVYYIICFDVKSARLSTYFFRENITAMESEGGHMRTDIDDSAEHNFLKAMYRLCKYSRRLTVILYIKYIR